MTTFLVLVLRDAVPIGYVALAAVLSQRAGIYNLGLEGLMITGAFCSVIVAKESGSLAVGLATAVVACVGLSALLWVVIELLGTQPVIAGLGVSGLGLGGTDFAVQAIYGSEGSVQSPRALPRLAFLPGQFGSLSILVGVFALAAAGTWWFVCRSRRGLQLTACGEHPFAARAVGVNPARRRLEALCLGGILCALGGSELALGSLQSFSVNMTSGRGYLAFAAAIFGLGHPLGACLTSGFFGVLDYADIKAQLGFGASLPPELIQAVPYLATVLGIWFTAVLRGRAVRHDELRDYQ